MSPDGKTRNRTDCALSSQRGIDVVTNWEVITKADIGSDHRFLVKMALRLNKRLARLKIMKNKNVFNINTQKLKGMKRIFEINIKTD